MGDLLRDYEHVFVAVLFLGVLYLVWKNVGLELKWGSSDAAPPAGGASGFRRRGFRGRRY